MLINCPTVCCIQHTYSTVEWVVVNDWYCNVQLFTHDCSRGVSDTLYHSRHHSRDRQAQRVQQWNNWKILSHPFTYAALNAQLKKACSPLAIRNLGIRSTFQSRLRPYSSGSSLCTPKCLNNCQYKKAQLSLTNPRDAKSLPKLLQLDVPTTLSLTILAYLHAFNCYCVRNPRNPEKFTENSNLWSSRSSKVIDIGVSRKPICDLLLVINSNFRRICYRFRDIHG